MATAKTTYDFWGRPATSTSSDAVATAHTYSYNPNTQTATLDADVQGLRQWKKTTLDGFGCAIEVDSGYDTTTVTIVETQYTPCACSSIKNKKMWRTALPTAPGAYVQRTTHNYHARRRTLRVMKPDGSMTHRSYAGNTTTGTGPAGKWKKFTYDGPNNPALAAWEPAPPRHPGQLPQMRQYCPAHWRISGR